VAAYEGNTSLSRGDDLSTPTPSKSPEGPKRFFDVALTV